MIIDRAFRWIGGAALVLGAWTAVMLVLPLVGPAGRMVAVVGEGPDALRQIVAAEGRMVDSRNGVTLARGGPGFAASLYRAGAPLVLEGRIAAGCFSGAAKAGA